MVDGARGRIKVGVAGEDAVLAIDNGRDEVALRVDGRDTLAVDDGTGFRREVVPDFRQGFFEFVDFLERHGSPRLAFDAAFPAAGREVAAEIFGQYVGREQYLAHLQYG